MSKKIVHYSKVHVIGEQAVLTPVNHTNHVIGQAVSNTKEVLTSTVQSICFATGCIETLNTCYMPLTDDCKFTGEQVLMGNGGGGSFVVLNADGSEIIL